MDKQQAAEAYAERWVDEKCRTAAAAGWLAGNEAQQSPSSRPPGNSVEPNWKEEIAELSSRPSTDPYQIAVNKIYNLLQGVADEELKSILCMAFLKHAIEPLVQSVASPGEAVAFLDWIDKQRWQQGRGFWFKPNVSGKFKTTDLYQLFNPSGAAPQEMPTHINGETLDEARKEVHYLNGGN